MYLKLNLSKIILERMYNKISPDKIPLDRIPPDKIPPGKIAPGKWPIRTKSHLEFVASVFTSFVSVYFLNI